MKDTSVLCYLELEEVAAVEEYVSPIGLCFITFPFLKFTFCFRESDRKKF
jgi:hypothetical protein